MMLIKVELKGIQIFPSQVSGKFAYEKNVVLVIRNLQGRALFVDYVTSRLGSYSPPPFLQGKLYYYEVIRVPEEYSNYVDCVAKEVEEKLNPVFRNKRLECKKEVTVVVEGGVV